MSANPNITFAASATVLDVALQAKADYFTRRELADAVKVCPHTIQRAEKRGLIKSIRLNSRVVRYPRTEVERFLRHLAGEK